MTQIRVNPSRVCDCMLCASFHGLSFVQFRKEKKKHSGNAKRTTCASVSEKRDFPAAPQSNQNITYVVDDEFSVTQRDNWWFMLFGPT